MIPVPVVAGNWKLNNGPAATGRYFDELLPRLRPVRRGTVVICPPAVSLAAARHSLRDREDVLLGVQNVHWEASGAFTGEISAPLAAEAGAGLALVGHSERRHLFGESDSDCALKVRAVLDAGLLAVFCVGELLEERESGAAEAVVERQLRAVTDRLQPDDLARLAVAYEPVWAIGTGRTATPDDAAAMHAHIRAQLGAAFPPNGGGVPILYGGSVKVENAAALLEADGVDGLLIGGASLDPAGFATICDLAGLG